MLLCSFAASMGVQLGGAMMMMRRRRELGREGEMARGERGERESRIERVWITGGVD